MSARLIKGKETSREVLLELRHRIEKEQGGGRPPGLAAILVGDDPASEIYVRNKMKACDRCGVVGTLRHLPATASQEEVAAVMEELNGNSRVDGILLQLPLPEQLDPAPLLAQLRPDKDVDGLHTLNLGKLAADDPTGFVPCTPAGVVELLERYDVAVEGRRVVVIGRSNLVGKPLALLLMRRHPRGNATVTVVHTRSRDVPEIVRQADIVIAAAGSPQFVKGDWLRPGVVVIDVGIHRLAAPEGEKARLVGDVDFEAAVEVASAITPVPGGVGPMTVAMLLSNTVLSWQRHRGV
jgi:methylenetetrahydrofolate dehydrogenase (NADP+)/methenyltetrahydrofolate cyclohydrolase